MTELQILEAFDREINTLDDVVNKPSSDDSLYWLNQAVSKFVKLRFNGDFVHKTSYEQNEKRYKDLIKLFRQKDLPLSPTVISESCDSRSVTYPEDFLFTLNEDVVIQAADGSHKMSTCVFECTADNFMYRVNNSLTDFHYRHFRARPLRVRTLDGCELLTDKNYKIVKYTLGYLKQPKEITLEHPFEEYVDFEDIVILEIVKMAAQMYLENKSDKRYQTITNEVHTQE